MGSVVKFLTLGRFVPRELSPGTNSQKTGWDPQPVRTLVKTPEAINIYSNMIIFRAFLTACDDVNTLTQFKQS